VAAFDLLTAKDSEDAQRRIAGALSVLGIRRSDRIALSLTNSPAVINTALAALRIGVVPVMLDPLLTDVERDAILADCTPSLVLTSRADAETLAKGKPVDLAPVPLSRPIHYTSGTTGRRKGVFTGVLDEDSATQLLAEETTQWGFNSEDRHLVVSGLYHSAPLRFAISTLMNGGDVVVMSRFEPSVFLQAMAHMHPTTMFCAPAHLQRMVDVIDTGVRMPSVVGVRLVAHAGAACSQPLKKRVHHLFEHESVWEFYGATEGQVTALSPQDWIAAPGSVGRARAGRSISIDDDGTIWTSVPDYARFTYWGDAEKTVVAWRGDAFTVGDMGRLDGDFLYLDGRRDDLIISGGVNVYPREVELAFEHAPGVTDIAVFGRPDERWGQRVCAVIVGSADDTSLQQWAEGHLHPARRPKEYHHVTVIPRSPTGKVRHRFLAEELGLEPPA
jgi:long-chain acyl-CoA synthetase